MTDSTDTVTRPPTATVPGPPQGQGVGTETAERPPWSRRPGELLRGLSRLMRTAALYGASHPVTGQTLGEVHGLITQRLASRPVVRLAIYDDMFFLDDTLLLEESLQLYSMIGELHSRRVAAVEFHQGVEPWELGRLAEVLNLGAGEMAGRGGAAAVLAEHSVRHIAAGDVGSLPTKPTSLKVDPMDAYRAALRALEELNAQASRDLPLALHKARMLIASFIRIITADRLALMGVAALRNYDEDTCHHSVNVGILSLLVGFHLGLDRTLLGTVGLAALLHDIGKMRVPREILTKPGRLTPEEFEIVQRHPIHGAHLLRDLTGQARLAMVVAFEHHANYDLSGYPTLAGRRLPHVLSRLIQITDYFDAMTSARRPYRRPLLPSEAIQEVLDGIGTVYDPVLAKVFIHVMGLYPVGSVVELDTGEVGVVIRPGEVDISRPMVRVVRDRLWEPIPAYTADLEVGRERHIARALDPVDAGIDPADYL